MKKIEYLTLIVLSVFLQCTHLPVQDPGNSGSIIGIMVSGLPMDEIYFVKLEENDNIIGHAHRHVRSNFLEGDFFYYLNVPPGRYIAVASFKTDIFQQTDAKGNVLNEVTTYYTIFFPMKIVELSDRKIGPGEIVFMGEYQVDFMPVDITADGKGLDAAQLFYCTSIRPETFQRKKLSDRILNRIFTREYSQTVPLIQSDTSAHAEKKFLEKTRKILQGNIIERILNKTEISRKMPWILLIDNRLGKITN